MSCLCEATATEPADKQLFRRAPVYPTDLSADVLFRLKFDGTSVVFVGWMEMEDAVNSSRKLHREKAILAEALIGCSRYMAYMAFHTSYLAGGITMEEFHEASKDFCIKSGTPIEQLADKIVVIIRETGQAFPPEQLEEFCSATGEEVADALRMLEKEGLVILGP